MISSDTNPSGKQAAHAMAQATMETQGTPVLAWRRVKMLRRQDNRRQTCDHRKPRERKHQGAERADGTNDSSHRDGGCQQRTSQNPTGVHPTTY